MKRAKFAAGLLLVALSVTACGGSDEPKATSAPEKASVKEFCTTFQDMSEEESGKKVADMLSEVGTPEDIPAEARQGFEVLIDKIADLDSDPSEDELTALSKDLSAGDLKDVTAFLTYAATTCG
ncbi:exported hypothetical protein [metagenome]|uniref:Lipoprotein n=1 Tax=metagenome TaxID=256318 RepID=A0A2P2CH79_9ZZZZ